jgi:quercetin dioxygenase-like cupin family protein
MPEHNEETYPDAVQEVMAQVHQVAQAASLSPALRARVQTAIATLVPAAPFASAPPLQLTELPAQLAALFDVEEAQARRLLHTIAAAPGPPWRRCAFADVRLLPVAGGPRVAGATCFLVYGQQGLTFPRHRHRGEEWTLVLQGWVEEENGHCWGPGDLLHRAVGSLHALHAVGTAPCICAIVDAGGFEIVAAPRS